VKLAHLRSAADDFTQAIQFSPGGNPEFYIERAQAVAALGANHVDEAIRGLDEGIRKMGPLVTFQLPAIDLEVSVKRYDAALARVDSIMAKLTRKESWFVRRADILKKAGCEKEAKESYRAALDAYQRSPAHPSSDPRDTRSRSKDSRSAGNIPCSSCHCGRFAKIGARTSHSASFNYVGSIGNSANTRTKMSALQKNADCRSVTGSLQFGQPMNTPATLCCSLFRKSGNFFRNIGGSALLLLIIAFGERTSAAALVTRGPYLQSGSWSNVIVRWRTDEECDSFVRFGPGPTNLNRGVTNLTVTTEHEVRLTGLTTNTKYSYAIGASNEVLAGDATFSFVTAPSPGTQKPTRIWAIGDFGTRFSAVRRAQRLHQFHGHAPHRRLANAWRQCLRRGSGCGVPGGRLRGVS
jgi:hypothetical protein